jgi:hypothetical protein
MRIVKGGNVEVDIERIAQEMINIETGVEVYRDGRLLPVESRVQGYPALRYGNVEYRVKASEGYVYFGGGLSVGTASFMKMLAKHVMALESSLMGSPQESHLVNYHTANAGIYTNVKVRNQTMLTVLSTDRHKNYKNVKRVFVNEKDDADRSTVRFVWHVLPISKFNFTIDNSMTDTISRFVCSIFYDMDNVSIFNDNAFSVEFTKQCFVGSRVLVNETILLSGYHHPLAFELNKYWRENLPIVDNIREVHRNISPDKVFRGVFSELRLRPTRLVNGNVCDDVCSRCYEKLYGDIYVLCGPVKQPGYELGIPVCPLCIHLSDKKIENKYLYMFRVAYPRTIEKIIDELRVTDDKKRILRAANCSVVKKYIYENGKTIQYWELGGEFLVFEDADTYLFSKLSTYNDKRVVTLAESVREYGDMRVVLEI